MRISLAWLESDRPIFDASRLYLRTGPGIERRPAASAHEHGGSGKIGRSLVTAAQAIR
jgi:hypothetical protein